MKPKDLFVWWWNYDAPWWAWILMVLAFGMFSIKIIINI